MPFGWLEETIQIKSADCLPVFRYNPIDDKSLKVEYRHFRSLQMTSSQQLNALRHEQHLFTSENALCLAHSETIQP